MGGERRMRMRTKHFWDVFVEHSGQRGGEEKEERGAAPAEAA